MGSRANALADIDRTSAHAMRDIGLTGNGWTTGHLNQDQVLAVVDLLQDAENLNIELLDIRSMEDGKCVTDLPSLQIGFRHESRGVECLAVFGSSLSDWNNRTRLADARCKRQKTRYGQKNRHRNRLRAKRALGLCCQQIILLISDPTHPARGLATPEHG